MFNPIKNFKKHFIYFTTNKIHFSNPKFHVTVYSLHGIGVVDLSC